MDPKQSVVGGLELISSTINTVRAYSRKGSLTEVAKVARVEPMAVVDTDCSNLEYMPDIMQSMLNIFSAYYLQAASILGTTVNNVSIVKKLAPLNPNRSIFLTGTKLSAEAYAYKLPVNHSNRLAAENSSLKVQDAPGVVTENANLSVGKLFNVEIKENGDSATIPISIRLMSHEASSSVIVNMFTDKSGDDYNLVERYHAWRSGRIEFLKDLILCKDLIDKNRRNLIRNNNDVYNKVVHAENFNRLAGLITKNPSLATISNIVVMSDSTAAQIELKRNVKLKDFSKRQELLEGMNVMLLAVVDKAYERVSIYHYGINDFTNVSIREIKSSNKSTVNVTDILTAMMRGSSAPI